MTAVVATQASWNVVRAVSRFTAPVVTLTVRGLSEATGQFVAAPARVTVWLPACSPSNRTVPFSPSVWAVAPSTWTV